VLQASSCLTEKQIDRERGKDEEEDTCMSYEEEDTCMSYEEEDTCMSYEEEDTCMKGMRQIDRERGNSV
jgi:hypothetical protein